MAVKAKSHENLEPSNILKVINLLGAEKPITKKEACDILNISYNTTRLNNIIQEYTQREEIVKSQKAIMRGKPVTSAEKSTIISSYLSGTSLTEISDMTYRSTTVIKNVLKSYHVPLRSASNDYFNPIFVETVKTDYKKGDLVYSARYCCTAYIHKLVQTTEECNVYRIYLTGDNEQFAVQPDYELVDLTKIQNELDVNIELLSSDEIKQLIYEALIKAKKNAEK